MNLNRRLFTTGVAALGVSALAGGAMAAGKAALFLDPLPLGILHVPAGLRFFDPARSEGVADFAFPFRLGVGACDLFV